MARDRLEAVERDLVENRSKNDLAQLDHVSNQDLRRAERNSAGANADASRTEALLWAVAALVVAAVIGTFASSAVAESAVQGRVLEVPDYIGNTMGDGLVYEYYEIDPAQQVVSGPYGDPSEVPEPAWHSDAVAEARVPRDGDGIQPVAIAAFSVVAAVGTYAAVCHLRLSSAWAGATSDFLLNDNEEDMHQLTPKELDGIYHWAPDAGASVPYECSALISHSFLSNSGLKKVEVAKRHKEDDPDRDIVAGMVVEDEEGRIATERVPMIDEPMAGRIFDRHAVGGTAVRSRLAEAVDGLPDNFLTRTVRRALDGSGVDRSVRRILDPTEVEVLGGGTLADEINAKWVMDPEEPQRPAGAYRVSTEDNHVMIVASTRTGKTQNYILPFLDVVRRQEKKPNLIVADMKGEIVTSLYASLEHSGYDIRQFNFFNEMHSNVINCLQICAEFMADGKGGQASSTMERITQCFFPKGKGDDTFWNDAASNCYQMCAWMLVDIVNRTDDRIRASEARGEIGASRAETLIDENWGALSFRNIYQFFRAMAGSQVQNPANAYKEIAKSMRAKAQRLEEEAAERTEETGLPCDPAVEDEVVRLRRTAAETEAAAENDPASRFWNGHESLDMMSVYCNALLSFPQNKVREQVGFANASISSMKDSEKTIASIYGVASTQMSQFKDENLARITSGRKSQNLDIYSFSFPRRISFRFESGYARRRHIRGRLCRFEAFRDRGLTEPMGPEYEHEEEVDSNGWVSYVWEGIMPDGPAYIRCRIFDGNRMQEVAEPVYFRFTKGWRTRNGGRIYVRTLFTDERVAEGGQLTEMTMVEDASGRRLLAEGRSMHRAEAFDCAMAVRHWDRVKERIAADEREGFFGTRQKIPAGVTVIDVPRVSETRVSYCERPKAVFFMTDLTKTHYLPILLIYLHQQFDANVSEAYVRKATQKPQVATLYILDEAGNLKSSTNGIPELATKFSLGLAQRQGFTMVFQTKEQLKSVYSGESDTIESNALVEILMGSKDNEFLKEMSERTGVKHVVRPTSATEDHNPAKLGGQVKNEFSLQKSVVEANVISVNALRTMTRGQCLVLDRGGYPIFNKLDTMMPPDHMSRQMKISDPHRRYTAFTLPSSSGPNDFSLDEATPDFYDEFDRVLWLASHMDEAVKAYCAYMGLDVVEYKNALDRDRDKVSRDVLQIAEHLVEERREELRGAGRDLPHYSRNRYDDVEYETSEREANEIHAAFDAKVVIAVDGEHDLKASHLVVLGPDGPGGVRPDIDGDLLCALAATLDHRDVRKALGAQESGREVSVEGTVVLERRRNPTDTAELAADDLERQMHEAFDLYEVTDDAIRWLCGPNAPTGAARGRLEGVFKHYCEVARPQVLGYDSLEEDGQDPFDVEYEDCEDA